MAQIKRKKVSRKAVQGVHVKRNPFKSIAFDIVFGIFCAAFIAVCIVGGIHLYNHYHEEETVDYFEGEFEVTNNGNVETVTFDKNTFEGILTYKVDNIDGENYYQKHIFFFAYDSTQFYPDKSIDDGKDKDKGDEFLYNKDHEKALQAAVDIQNKVNQYNAKVLADDPNNTSELVHFYIVDISFGSNTKLKSNADFGNKDSDFVFGYINGVDGFTEKYKSVSDKNEYELSTTSYSTFYTSTVKRVLAFIDQNLDVNM